jgi:hypothetical protein
MEHAWGEEECIQSFDRNARRKETAEYLDVDGWIILNWILEK